MKKILVPTDFSPCANLSADTALQIAKKFGASVEFLHSVKTNADWAVLANVNDSHHPEVQKLLDFALNELSVLEQKAIKEEVKANIHLAHDYDSQDIINFSKKLDCDMMVMGTKCSSGMKEYFTGTLTQKITRLSKLIVLALKAQPQSLKFDNIVFASDFDPECNNAIELIKNFALKFQSKLSLLYINTPGNIQHSVKRKKYMGDIKMKYDSIISSMYIENATNEYEGILNYAKNHHPDLIAITTHNRQGLDYLIAGSRTDQILERSNTPVLIVPV